jgi:MFS family permease
VRLVTHGLMAALLIADAASVAALAVLAAVGATASAFFTPAIGGIMPQVVSDERLQQANALRGMAESTGRIAGPLLAGVLVASAGAGWALAVDAATYGISALFLARLSLPGTVPLPAKSFLADLREGWDDWRSRTWLWTTVTAASVGNLFFASYFVLGPLVADRELGGAAAWGLIGAGFGLGLLAGTFVVMRIDPRHPVLVASLAVLLYGLPLAALALALPAPVIAAVGFVAGAGLMVANNLWETTEQRHVPPEKLSRVNSYSWFGSLATQPIGMLAWGPIAVAVGVETALWVAFAVQTAIWLATLAVREVRELPARPLGPGERLELAGAQEHQ